ncbi:hypothetical protein BCEP4_1230030 [Burkholderia cepacia]|nr:hypothetical protein BCEP4_1230030 [Burkholderia cepacia]
MTAGGESERLRAQPGGLIRPGTIAQRVLESGGHEKHECDRHGRSTHRFERTGCACFIPGDHAASSSS